MKKIIVFMFAMMINTSLVMAHPILGFPRHKGVEPLKNKQYESSCGECHFAYQPGLLPARSWAKMMEPDQLEDHFGENAELAESERLAVLNFLTEHAADTTWHYKRSIKVNRSIPEGETPLRITQVPYIKKKHGDIPDSMIRKNKGVRSLSYCNKCHMEASHGEYDNGTVRIPNFKDWEDLID